MGHKTSFLLFFLGGFLFIVASAYSMVMVKEPYVWYDDDNRAHTVFLDPYYVAILHQRGFIHPSTKSIAALKEHSEYTVRVNESPKVSIYRSERPFLKLKDNLGKSSPVFSKTKSGAAKLVLMGGVLVTFKKDIPQEDIHKIIEREELKVLKIIKYSRKSVYLIDSDPGLDSLELANRLRLLEEVVSASPNWAEPYSLR